MTEPRRALILDFDGVLVDTEPIHFASWNQAFDDLHGVRRPGGHEQLVGLSLQQIYQHWLGPRALEISDEQKGHLLAHKTALFFELGREVLQPMPGSLDLIQQARANGWYVAVASRSRRQRLLRTLDLIRLPAHFDLILGEEDVVDPVTDRKIHTRAAQVFDINPVNCVVIEDSLSGVADAVAAGIGRVVGLTTSFAAARLRAAGAHEVVDHLEQVRLVMDVGDSSLC
jgi:HAD superfamily hydrolase (TIGR01509 family)